MKSMQSLALALPLILLMHAAFAAAPLQSFLSHSFEPDMPVQAVPLLANGSYSLVSSGGNETYVVGADGNAVKGASAIASILEQDARNRDGYASEISSALAFPSQVNAAKNASEAKCLQYIGDDGDPGCNDRQSCIVSCFSSPQCSVIVQAGGFIEASMEWDFARKNFSSALFAYSDGLANALSDPQAIDSKIAALSNLSAIAQNMSQNGIFLTKDDPGCSGKNATLRCFEYCPKIDYSIPLISSQAQNLASLKATISDVAGQGARAAAIEARGNANDAYLSSRIGDYDDFSILMLNSIRNLKAQSGELAKTVRDPQIAPGISQLENISAQAKNYSDSGRYHSALSMRAPFGELSNSTSGAISADGAKYSSLKNALGGFSGKVDSSEWLIGNASASAYQKNLSALEAAYAPPLTLNQMASESAALSSLENALDAELAAKAVSAGNSSSQPKPSSGLPCLPALIPPALLLIAFAHAGWRRL